MSTLRPLQKMPRDSPEGSTNVAIWGTPNSALSICGWMQLVYVPLYKITKNWKILKMFEGDLMFINILLL